MQRTFLRRVILSAFCLTLVTPQLVWAQADDAADEEYVPVEEEPQPVAEEPVPVEVAEPEPVDEEPVPVEEPAVVERAPVAQPAPYADDEEPLPGTRQYVPVRTGPAVADPEPVPVPVAEEEPPPVPPEAVSVEEAPVVAHTAPADLPPPDFDDGFNEKCVFPLMRLVTGLDVHPAVTLPLMPPAIALDIGFLPIELIVGLITG